MFILLCVGYFFLLIYILAIVLICHFLITQGTIDPNDPDHENNLNKIMKSLSRVKFSDGAFGQLSPESECVICMQSYGENDMITTLACNEKHFFHT